MQFITAKSQIYSLPKIKSYVLLLRAGIKNSFIAEALTVALHMKTPEISADIILSLKFMLIWWRV
jgi:hypothetical protein